MPEASRSFTAALSAVGDARRFLLEVLEDWSEEGYDFGAPLVLTELVTNAVLHARSPYEVRIRLDATHLAVEVHDTSPRLPHLRQYELDATTGRGIALVTNLCSDWGVAPTEHGKVVWAHVRPDSQVDLETPVEDLDDLDAVIASIAPAPATESGRTSLLHRALAA